jgi:hypothetical protein
MQRIGGGAGTAVVGKAATGEEREAASSFMTETFNQLFGANKDSQIAATASVDTDASISTTETLSLLDRMQERLGLDGKLDAKQLAALAAVQGLALSSLRKHLAAAGKGSSTTENASTKASSSVLDTRDSIYDPSRHITFTKLGLSLPDSMTSHFEGEWCLRLQNFANAAGYRSVLLGGVPCNGISISSSSAVAAKLFPQTQVAATTAPPTPPATAVLHWNSEAAFSLDCGIKEPHLEPSQEVEESIYSGISAMLHAARAKASSEITAALQAKTMECTIAVSAAAAAGTSSGISGSENTSSGAVLHSSQTLPLFNAHKLNAIKIRICNIPIQTAGPAISNPTPTTSGVSTIGATGSPTGLINVHGIKVNNRPLIVDSLQGHPSNECHVALVRLPTRALADGFLLNGYLTLEKGGSTNGSTDGSSAVYNVGEMASVEMQIGSLRLLSTSVDGAAGEEEEGGGGSLPSSSPPPPLP